MCRADIYSTRERERFQHHGGGQRHTGGQQLLLQPQALIRNCRLTHSTPQRKRRGVLSSRPVTTHRQLRRRRSTSLPPCGSGTVLPVSQLVSMATKPTSLSSHPAAFCTSSH
uniref:Uncharacterized protein n=1 Tax=Knipowitschia caucasica TaxID=637954 RepID=A0AAV2MIG3_KNICA